MSELKVNTISEVTGANGVVIDSTKLKDGGVIIADAGNIGSASDTDALAISSGGVVTFTQKPVINSGVAIDNITIDGTEIDLSSGDLTLDVAGDIILDADGGDVKINDGGTAIAELTNSSTDFVIKSVTNDKDIIFKGVDNSSAITALTLDMSAAGEATFNAGIVIADAGNIGSASDKVAIAIASDGDVTFSQKVGIVSAHDLGVGLHIKIADTGASASANADELVIEGAASGGNEGISILSATDGTGQLVFGDSGDNDIGRVYYNHGDNSMRLYTNGTEHLRIDSAGHVTMPNQSAFMAHQTSGQTNVGNNTTIQFPTEVLDLNGDYNNSNYTFTAPVTGKYMVNVQVSVAEAEQPTYNRILIETSNRQYKFNIESSNHFDANPTYLSKQGSLLVDMDASDTCYIAWGQSGGSSTADPFDSTQFSIHLVA